MTATSHNRPRAPATSGHLWGGLRGLRWLLAKPEQQTRVTVAGGGGPRTAREEAGREGRHRRGRGPWRRGAPTWRERLGWAGIQDRRGDDTQRGKDAARDSLRACRAAAPSPSEARGGDGPPAAAWGPRGGAVASRRARRPAAKVQQSRRPNETWARPARDTSSEGFSTNRRKLFRANDFFTSRILTRKWDTEGVA